mmetsp:Transcript_66943/g.139783  ORF Transcript_66943/g.139783 Transcript_66943/m.139783 type:complete len:156 (+) Transcript_66943:71-538(+)
MKTLLLFFCWCLSLVQPGAAALVSTRFGGQKVNPGAATTTACSKLETLKAKFLAQQNSTKEDFAAETKNYATKICEGTGCEQNDAERERFRAEWSLVQKYYTEELARLESLLERVEDTIAEPPFRRCPEFEEYLAKKSQLAHGKDLMDNQTAPES